MQYWHGDIEKERKKKEREKEIEKPAKQLVLYIPVCNIHAKYKQWYWNIMQYWHGDIEKERKKKKERKSDRKVGKTALFYTFQFAIYTQNMNSDIGTTCSTDTVV